MNHDEFHLLLDLILSLLEKNEVEEVKRLINKYLDK